MIRDNGSTKLEFVLRVAKRAGPGRERKWVEKWSPSCFKGELAGQRVSPTRFRANPFWLFFDRHKRARTQKHQPGSFYGLNRLTR